MCRNYQELEFTHFVVVTADGTIFGCAKENGYTYNFLIRRESVRAQNGDQWHELEPELAHLVRQRAEESYARAPTYRTNRLLID